jgi:anti-anti-sigma factor
VAWAGDARLEPARREESQSRENVIMVTSIQKTARGTVLKLHQDIVDMESGDALKAALMELYNAGEKRIILDLSGVSLINSHGIGKILMFYKRFREAGVELHTLPLRGSIKEIFEILMLDSLIPAVRPEA